MMGVLLQGNEGIVIYTIEDAKKNKIIAFLIYISDEQEEMFLNENILLRKITEREKEHFINIDFSFETYPNYCFEFIITEEYFKQIDESELKDGAFVSDMASKLIRMEEAINLCNEHPCSIIRIDISDEEYYYPDIGEDYYINTNRRHFEDIKCKIQERDLELINLLYSKLLEIYDNGEDNRDYKKFWWLIAVEYYNKFDKSINFSDQIIDLIIGLESLLSYENTELSYRLKLRTSLYLYYINKYYPKQIQQIIKEMYILRSKIVHGSISLIELASTEITYIPGTDKKPVVKVDMLIAVRMLRNILRIMLVETILNFTDKSKKDFIEFIDSICFMDIDPSKTNLIEDHKVAYHDIKKDSIQ